jgi:hypothetical protein
MQFRPSSLLSPEIIREPAGPFRRFLNADCKVRRGQAGTSKP